MAREGLREGLTENLPYKLVCGTVSLWPVLEEQVWRLGDDSGPGLEGWRAAHVAGMERVSVIVGGEVRVNGE